MANYVVTTYKLPDDLATMETYVNGIVDTKDLKIFTYPERPSGKTVAIVYHLT